MADPTMEAAVSNLDLGPTESGAASGGHEEGGTMRIGRRCYIGNLAWRTSWQDLKDKFREVGSVVYANVVKDESGRSKGWGIVEFETPEEAVAAVNTLNGTDLGGRNMLVREDREDRDVKAFNRENDGGEGGYERPPRARRERGRGGRGRGRGEGGPPGMEGGDGSQQRPPRPPRREPPADQSSGLQIVVQGLPWAHTSEDLQPMFEPYGTIEHCEVVYGRDNRSRGTWRQGRQQLAKPGVPAMQGYGTVRYQTAEAAQAAIQQVHGTDLEGRMLTVRLDKFA